MQLIVNGIRRDLDLDPRMSLLDLLREVLDLSGAKKGCNQGGCGACTVLMDGRRILSCLTLALQCNGKSVTTIEGIAHEGKLHPLQRAFIEHDGFQCGYCTPGQICSAIGMAEELAQGMPSRISMEARSEPAASAEEIRERMSGNLCRCGAYNGIVAAIRETLSGEAQA
jgi:xanthine dehydrogenase YagT iron-sulfur-binding subunit